MDGLREYVESILENMYQHSRVLLQVGWDVHASMIHSHMFCIVEKFNDRWPEVELTFPYGYEEIYDDIKCRQVINLPVDLLHNRGRRYDEHALGTSIWHK